eukprot:gene17329-22873_t
MVSRDNPFDMQIKLLMVGDCGVGKSRLMLRYSSDTLALTTIGIEFKIKNIQLDGLRIKLQIWNTAGSERFRTITTSYFRGAHGILLVYDVTDRQTFESIRNWYTLIQMHANENIKVILIGNKCDLSDQRMVSFEEGESLANECNIHFYETSAIENINVEKSFLTITTDVKNRLIADGGSDNTGGYRLKASIKHQSNKKGCY